MDRTGYISVITLSSYSSVYSKKPDNTIYDIPNVRTPFLHLRITTVKVHLCLVKSKIKRLTLPSFFYKRLSY